MLIASVPSHEPPERKRPLPDQQAIAADLLRNTVSGG